jgi:hypothetical protein
MQEWAAAWMVGSMHLLLLVWICCRRQPGSIACAAAAARLTVVQGGLASTGGSSERYGILDDIVECLDHTLRRVGGRRGHAAVLLVRQQQSLDQGPQVEEHPAAMRPSDRVGISMCLGSSWMVEIDGPRPHSCGFAGMEWFCWDGVRGAINQEATDIASPIIHRYSLTHTQQQAAGAELHNTTPPRTAEQQRDLQECRKGARSLWRCLSRS